MKLPKCQKDKFMYGCMLIHELFYTDFFDNTYKWLWEELDSDEQDSLMASYLVMVENKQYKHINLET